MASPLTQSATPAELVDSLQAIDIKQIIDAFPRLVDIVEADLSGLEITGVAAEWRQFPVAIKLRFGWADARHQLAYVQGEIGARVMARCQRCLEPVQYELDCPVNWLLVPPNAEAVDGAEREIWELDDERLRLVDIIEESLIMAMPLVAMHVDRTDCRAIAPSKPVQRSDKVRPFATLKSQMQDLK